jgi:DUF4097 and DUF4098 domain-containing protein YvlB
MSRTLYLVAVFVAAFTPLGFTQPPGGQGGEQFEWCNQRWNSRASYCEERDAFVAVSGSLEIDAGRNGGIRVRGSDRNDASVRARVAGFGSTEADARRISSQVRIVTEGGVIRAEGPERSEDSGWSVSFEVEVPRTLQMKLTTHNGGISLDDFQGAAEFTARNGGVTLRNVSGDIRGTTRNGGLNITLEGDRWNGPGLDVQTRNGGIRILVGERFSAQLETETINGHVRIGFPVTVQGDLGRHVVTTLGSGGARLRAATTNGSVTIDRR